MFLLITLTIGCVQAGMVSWDEIEMALLEYNVYEREQYREHFLGFGHTMHFTDNVDPHLLRDFENLSLVYENEVDYLPDSYVRMTYDFYEDLWLEAFDFFKLNPGGFQKGFILSYFEI